MEGANTKQTNRVWSQVCHLWQANQGAQIAELAVSLPLLALLFVATYDVGQAFNVKQKLVAATREAARFAANQSTSDLTNSASGNCNAPASICAVRDLIDSYLLAADLNDCGLGSTHAKSTTTWQFEFDASSSSCGTGNKFIVIINRQFTYSTTSTSLGGNVTVTVEATQVTMSYPYQWQFNRMIQILGTNLAVSPIPTSAVMQNMN